MDLSPSGVAARALQPRAFVRVPITLYRHGLGHGIGKVAVWVPVVVLPAEYLIRRDGFWFGRIELPHKIPFGAKGYRCQFRMPQSSRAP
jgi:hypothetical protein